MSRHHSHHHRYFDRRSLPFIIIPVLLAVAAVVFAVAIIVATKKADPLPNSQSTTPAEVHTHNYGEWIEEVPATCTEDGVKGHYHCSCGKNFDADKNGIALLSIPKGHLYGELIAAVAPTCTEAGQKAHYECSLCHRYFDAEKNELADILLPAAHQYADWTAEIPATGNKPGQKGYYECTVCHKKFDAEKTAEITDLVIPATGKYLVKVTGNLPGGIAVSGGAKEQLISEDVAFEPVTLGANYGYLFDHYEIDGVPQEGNTVTLGTVTDDVTIYVVCKYATEELPIVNIDTAGQEIADKENYVTMKFSMENCEGTLEDCAGGIRLRGNSTLSFPKKAYRVKFDKKQSLFGLTKAKSWVLLAEYIDPSALHNYTALTLRQEIDDSVFTPTPHKVNVYLNGEYQGLYTLCEQVQENEGRIDNEKKITAEMTSLKDFNFLIVMDAPTEAFVTVDDRDDDPDHGISFQIKYPEEDDFKNSSITFGAFKTELQAYLQDLVDAFLEHNSEYILSEVNMNSLLDYVIVDEIMGERDHKSKSVYLYFKDGKLNFGPIWDYDWCLYTNWPGRPNTQYTVSEEFEYSNIFFQTVHDTPELYQLLKERYTAVGSTALARTIEIITAYEATIQESVRLDAEKWYDTNEFKGYEVSQKNTAFLNAFLAKRQELLDAEWLIAE